ncbi:MAG: BatA and WFA domain-containing protein [Phycisphaerales bacterium]|jgi:hypothetical protein|nr:BatA and WFA domain-containing protein [Phycisphaerales bacterium]
MSWLAPWTAFWVLLAVIPALLALYILRLRRARQLVPTTTLWTAAAEDIQANTPFQRLRRNLLLLLQLVALAMLALAVAQPRLEMAAGRGARTVLLIDCSASMQAVEGGQTRFEQAIEAAMQAVDRLHPGIWFGDAGGQTMVVAMGDEAEIMQPFTGSRGALRAALERMEPADTTARLDRALAMARAWSAEPDPDAPRVTDGPARLEVFTDGGLPDLDQATLLGAETLVHLVGDSTAGNRSVQMVAAQRDSDDPHQVQVFATLWNWERSPRDERVQMSIENAAVHVEDMTLPAATLDDAGEVRPGVQDLVFTKARHSGEALIEVRLVGEDALPLDDAAWAVVPEVAPLRVHLVSEDPDFWSRALSVVPAVDVTTSTAAADVDLTVYDGVSPETLPDGPTLSINAPFPSALLEFGSVRPAESVALGDPKHPVFRGGAPGDLWVRAPQQVELDTQVRPVLRGADGPLVLAWEEGGHRRVHIAFDPTESTWPLHPTFVSFLVDALEWMAWRGADYRGAAMAGDRASVRLPEGVQTAIATGPGGVRRPLAVHSGRRAGWGPVDRAGPWVVRWDEPTAGHRFVAVRVPVQLEGDLRVPEAMHIGGVEATAAGNAAASTPLWPWALCGSLLVLLIEWAVYTSRIR